MSGSPGRMAAAGLGLFLDRIVGEPHRFHPVAGFGRLMGTVEDATWRDSRAAGLAYTAAGVGIGLAAGAAVRTTAGAVAVTSAGAQLRQIAGEIAALLAADDLESARAALPALVGRDVTHLDAAGIAAAVIESLAENTVDAAVAPTLWGAAGGAAGATTYRAVNTMDAMVGHRSARYERFGWASARLDDVANWVPARAFALLLMAALPGRAFAIATAVRRDAGTHPSPNAGVAEAAMAGALGRELGGPLHYGDRYEDRPRLGTGPRPTATDITVAIGNCARVEALLAGTLIVPWVIAGVRDHRPKSP